MLSNQFAALLAPFKMLCNKNALAITYRCLELHGKMIRGAARFGMMEVHGEFGIPEGPPIYVDGMTFLAIIGSLPSEEEVELNLEDKGVLAWQCGAARGRIALMSIPEMPSIKRGNKNELAWVPTGEFIDVLKLGMLSCGNESLASIGAYGVVLDNTNDLCVYSSDNVTIAAAYMSSEARIQGPDIMTFSPDSLNLLAAVIDTTNDKAKLEFDDQGIYYRDGTRRCVIKQIAPLKVDINSICAQYASSEIMVEIPTARVQAFLKRISAMAETKKSTSLFIGASKGKLNLSFSDGLASSEEYYLVDELNVPDLPLIELDGAKLGRALAHTSHVVLDYIDRHVLLLQGGDPIFQYIISGKL